MYSTIFLSVAAFVLSLVLTPLCRDFFLRRGLIDQPDGKRKTHIEAVPRMGGLPIAIAYGGALLLLFCVHRGSLYIQHEQLFHALLPAAAIVFATGLLDDIRGLRPRQKLLGQLIAAGVAVSLGIRLATFPTHPLTSTILSVLWLVGCTNAVNLIDGMDGLATGVGLLATLTTLAIAVLAGNHGLVLATVPLAAALLGFLRYNFAPASVFLGDCGSLTIGFTLGCFGLIWSQRSGSLLGMLGPLICFALPLVDVLLAICRRFLRRVPIFQGDRGHIHHKVLSLGFSTRGAALLLYGVCSLLAALAVEESLSNGIARWPALVIFVVLAIIGIRRLGYVEFKAASRMFTSNQILNAVQDEILLHELDEELAVAETMDDYWRVVRGVCRELRVAAAYFDCDGRTYEEHFVHSAHGASCQIHLTFGEFGRLTIERLPESAPPRVMMAVLDRIHSAIGDRLLLPPARRIHASSTAA